MKFLKGLLVFVAIIAVIVLVAIMLLPSNVTVERTKVMDAPVADVYNQVAELKNWENWNPWLEKDANVKLTYADQTTGEGAWYSWNSEHPEVGNGKLSISESTKNATIGTVLEFDGMDPGKGVWKFEKEGNGTKVTWAMVSDLSGMGKLFGPMLDGMVGPDFEKGLENIEKAAKDNPAWQPIQRNSSGSHYLYTRQESNMKDMGSEVFAAEYGKLMGHIMSNGIEMNGQPLAVYEQFDEASGDMIVRFAIPIKEAIDAPEGMMVDQLPSGNILIAKHVGPYEEVGPAWNNLKNYMETNNISPKGFPYEVYVNDPMEVKDPAKYITEVTFPV